MKVLATTTVIRGKGACEAYVNGLANEEMKKMQERYENELSNKEAELQATKNNRDDLRHKDLTEVRAMFAKPISIVERVRERLVIIWCQIYGIGEELKLWSYDKN